MSVMFSQVSQRKYCKERGRVEGKNCACVEMMIIIITGRLVEVAVVNSGKVCVCERGEGNKNEWEGTRSVSVTLQVMTWWWREWRREDVHQATTMMQRTCDRSPWSRENTHKIMIFEQFVPSVTTGKLVRLNWKQQQRHRNSRCQWSRCWLSGSLVWHGWHWCKSAD